MRLNREGVDVIDRKSNEIGLEICIKINRCNTRISNEEFDFEFGEGVSKDSR